MQTKLRNRFRKASALLLSLLMSVSLIPSAASHSADAASYSTLSALDQYAYYGSDLGATYTKNSTTFKVWAPTASSVKIKRYTTGSDSEAGAAVIETRAMTKGDRGIWSVTISGDLNGTYYTYLVTVDGTTRETVDIYARSTGVNGKRGMVLDLDSTDPAGWDTDTRVDCENQTDSIIWEVHVRDFPSSSDSGMTNKGKYLAFTETGTTVNNNGTNPTGIDYLEQLGVTHVHLLPVYDFASVDETKLSTDQFNWGYDPMNYNTPEGSYSTNPYDGSVRVNEFKRMGQSLHEKNIGVIMDVVYNHTYSGGSMQNDWFDYTVPGYYYRQSADGGYSNASGCGNETASDRAMYQKFMIDSVVYWATEYHLDGFRFDLMGVHDTDTMNKIRAALDEIDPDILIYGEPWTAAATTCPTPTAVQSNMYLVSEEVAAFNDQVRDAIKGSCFNAADWGFIQGGSGFETALKGGIQANSTNMATNKWSKQPSQTVTYTSAHDNYTLYDKLVKSVNGGVNYGTRDNTLVAMNKMAGGIILTSQGMSFFQAGEEFARSKYGNENSYNASTAINQLKWTNTITYSDIVDYYKGMIEIRKAYSPFRDPTNTSNGTIYFSHGTNCPEKVVAFTMYNKLRTDEWNFVAVLHNANTSAKTVTLQTYDGVTLPSSWVIIANGTQAGTESLGTTTGSTVTVPARSTMVLVDKTSYDSTSLTKQGKVTVNHILADTNKTVKTETLKGDVGSRYTTAPLSSMLNNGYQLSSSTSNTSGTFTDGTIAVNYYYTLDTAHYGTVTIQYIDADTGAAVAPEETYTGRIGSSYLFGAVIADGYEADESLTSNASGQFASGNKNITFYYHAANKDLTIHYYNTSWDKVAMYVYNESGTTTTLYTGTWPGTLMTNDGGGWYSGTVQNLSQALFIANNNNLGSQDPSGSWAKGYTVSGECWVKSEIVYPTGRVNVRYVTTDGATLHTEIIKGISDGTVAYTTSAKSFDGYKLSSSPSNSTGRIKEAATNVTYVYEKLAEQDPLSNDSTLSATSIDLGGSVKVTGAASGGTGSCTYAVYYKKTSDSAWTTAQNFSSNKTVTITPPSAGTYEICSKVKDSSGTVVKKYLNITVNSTQLTNQSTLSADSVSLGSSVKVTGAASGGTGGCTYAVYYRKTSGSAWTTAQGFTSNKTVTITPDAAGTFEICSKVKDSSGTVAKKYFTLTVTSTQLTNRSTLSADSIVLGNSVKVTSAASGGTGGCTYAVYYRKTSDSAWTTAQGFTSNKAVTITPPSAGSYEVCSKIKDSSGTIAKKYLSLTVTNAQLTNTSKISTTVVSAGTPVKITCAATGGTGGYTYAVYYQRTNASSWTTIQNYSTNKTVTITPSTAYPLRFCVKVKDSAGTVAKKYFTTTTT